MGKKRMPTFAIVLFASVITTVIALNFVSGEKEHHIRDLHLLVRHHRQGVFGGAKRARALG